MSWTSYLSSVSEPCSLLGVIASPWGAQSRVYTHTGSSDGHRDLVHPRGSAVAVSMADPVRIRTRSA